MTASSRDGKPWRRGGMGNTTNQTVTAWGHLEEWVVTGGPAGRGWVWTRVCDVRFRMFLVLRSNPPSKLKLDVMAARTTDHCIRMYRPRHVYPQSFLGLFAKTEVPAVTWVWARCWECDRVSNTKRMGRVGRVGRATTRGDGACVLLLGLVVAVWATTVAWSLVEPRLFPVTFCGRDSGENKVCMRREGATSRVIGDVCAGQTMTLIHDDAARRTARAAGGRHQLAGGASHQHNNLPHGVHEECGRRLAPRLDSPRRVNTTERQAVPASYYYFGASSRASLESRWAVGI